MVRSLSFLAVSWALWVGLAARELPAQSKGDDSDGMNASVDATADTTQEPLADHFSIRAATAYLDRRPHANEKDCFACHASFSYLPGRSTTDPLRARSCRRAAPWNSSWRVSSTSPPCRSVARRWHEPSACSRLSNWRGMMPPRPGTSSP